MYAGDEYYGDEVTSPGADLAGVVSFDDETCCESCGEPLDPADAVEVDLFGTIELWCLHCVEAEPAELDAR